MSVRVAETLLVLAGTFGSQQTAFVALMDVADAAGLSVDLADVDVIRECPEVRLAHYFRPAIVARIESMRGNDDTVIVVRPSPLTTRPGLWDLSAQLRKLGLFAGEVVRPGGPEVMT